MTTSDPRIIERLVKVETSLDHVVQAGRTAGDLVQTLDRDSAKYSSRIEEHDRKLQAFDRDIDALKLKVGALNVSMDSIQEKANASIKLMDSNSKGAWALWVALVTGVFGTLGILIQGIFSLLGR